MSLEGLYATQQAAHDALVTAGVASGARVRMPRRSTPHTGHLSLGTAARNAIEVTQARSIATVRFDNVRRNQYTTLTESHLDRLEVKVGSRYVPFAELKRRDGLRVPPTTVHRLRSARDRAEEEAMRRGAFERWQTEGAGMASLDLRAAAQHAQAIGDVAAERAIDAVLESREARGEA